MIRRQKRSPDGAVKKRFPRDRQELWKAIKKSDVVKNRGRYLLLLPSLIFMVIFAYIGPIAILYPFLQKYFVAGLRVGGVKG